MLVIEKKTKDIKPYKNNPRYNASAVAAVAESIKQCGYIAPIIVDENLEVLAGHTRLEAIKSLGYDTVAVRIAEGLTEEQKKKYRLLDNKTAELSEWDYNKLAAQIEELDFGGFDFELSEQYDAEDFGEDFSLPDGEKNEICTVSFNLRREQWDVISSALDSVEGQEVETYGNKDKKGNALYKIVLEYLVEDEAESWIF